MADLDLYLVLSGVWAIIVGLLGFGYTACRRTSDFYKIAGWFAGMLALVGGTLLLIGATVFVKKVVLAYLVIFGIYLFLFLTLGIFTDVASGAKNQILGVGVTGAYWVFMLTSIASYVYTCVYRNVG